MPAISIQNLSKTYPPPFFRLRRKLRLPVKSPVEALANVSFEVAEGEIFGLIGKNGAGKTTLTKIIATLIQPTDGRVLVRGFDSVADDVRVRSLVGLAAAEERSFYWRLTARQNLMFFARLYGMPDQQARQRIAELFANFDLVELADRRFSELSTGNKQRLSVARALIPDPPVLLLDEPTRSLDPLAAAKMRQFIGSLGPGATILLTSHNLSEIEELCDRVAIIANGRIRAVDTPANLRKKHNPMQQVSISLKSNTPESLQTLNNLTNFELEETGDQDLKIRFTRQADDELLGKTVAELTEKGARIVDVETEKPTLLDVLESYE